MRTSTKVAIMCAGVVALCSAYLFVYEPTYAGPIKPVAKTLIFGHRGMGNHSPDNSLIGARMAMDAKLAGVDVDGQMSRDSAFVIFHDLSVDRLTSGTGRVTSHSLAELKALDLAPKFGHGFTDAFVATFEDFLGATRLRGILMVELKVPGTGNTGFEAIAVKLVQKYDAFDEVYFSSFNPIVLWRLKKLDPRIHTVLIFMDTNWNPELLKEIKKGDEVNLPWVVRQEWIRRAIRKIVKPDLLSVNITVAPDVTRRLIAKGWPIFLWAPATDEAIRSAAAKKPYGIITDEPLIARVVLESGSR